MKLSAIALASLLTAVLASQAEPVSTHQLEARDPTFGLVHGILGGLLGGGHSSIRYPAINWKGNGRGNDGYSVDCYGNSRPHSIPQGWAWFGVEIGWAPTASWSCSSNYKFSTDFLSKAHLVTWFTPSLSWKKHNAGIDLGVTIDHWGLIPKLPSRGWTSNGSGRDGWTVDWQGNGRPSWAPNGFLWFGEKWGWQPSAGFDLSIGVNLPSVWLPKAHLCTWWTPSITWLNHHSGSLDISLIPSFWNFKPSAGWKCDGSGKDGWSVDHHGNGPPSWVPSSGWFWFGVEIGWQPSKSWSCGSSWTIPSEWQSSCGKATWWTPPSGWVSKHHGHNWHFGFQPPKHWGCEVPATTSPSLPPVHATTTPAKVTSKTSVKPTTEPCTTSSKVKTSVRPSSTLVKPKTTTSSKPKTTSHSSIKHTTTAKPKPTSSSGGGSNGGGSNVTVTKTMTATRIVTVPTSSTGGSCTCDEEQHRLARRNKSRLD
ncbi:uncharacterized protein JCM6883_003187 [Sporobolomyces salmoneus]|uniref:uncharacterized protein n=1 Tax=Sporobolomyces salmoneus TaxID=183962 RepID=UPI0031758E96